MPDSWAWLCEKWQFATLLSSFLLVVHLACRLALVGVFLLMAVLTMLAVVWKRASWNNECISRWATTAVAHGLAKLSLTDAAYRPSITAE